MSEVGPMTGMLDDTQIDSVAILQGIKKVLVDELGFLPDAVIILAAPDGQRRTFYAASVETVAALGPNGARKMLGKLLDSAAKQNRSIPVSAPARL